VLFAEYPDRDTMRVFKKIDEIDFSSDGRMIAGGGIGPDVFIWSTTGKYIRNLNYLDADSSERKSGVYADDESLSLPNAMINDLKFSPDGKFIAAGCRMPDPVATGGLIVVWDVETGKLLHWKAAHNYVIQSIGWSPDGKFIITGSNDKWMKVWNYADFKEPDPEPVFSYRNDFTPVHTSFTRDGNWIISAGIDGKIIIRQASDYKTIATLIGLDENDFVAVTADQYYSASRKGTRLIAFRQGNKVYPAEQFDIRYNRPDKVLEALGSKDTNMIRSYRNAYYKRIKKLGIDTSLFSKSFAAPQFDISGRDTIHYTQTNPVLLLHLKGSDSLYNLERFNVWINEVPLFGQKGIIYKGRKNALDTVITVRLSEGENRVETSVTNTNGTESYRSPLIVKYSPAQKIPSLVYFIGIGIDQFADSSYNLSYSTKDIRDLVVNLKLKYGRNLVVDTLFNRHVTVDNIRQLKQKLTGSN
jgi:WD40 repeat protein